MSVNRCARSLIFGLVLVLTSAANVLFIPVDNDGDECTPPVIIYLNFVAPRRMNVGARSHSTPRVMRKNQTPFRNAAAFIIASRFADNEILIPPNMPLRR
jgi:hypothetical protein